MFPSDDAMIREFDAVQLQVEHSLEQNEAVISEVQCAQAALLVQMEAAFQSGDEALLESLATKHGQYVAFELQLHESAGCLRSMMDAETRRIAETMAQAEQ